MSVFAFSFLYICQIQAGDKMVIKKEVGKMKILKTTPSSLSCLFYKTTSFGVCQLEQMLPDITDRLPSTQLDYRIKNTRFCPGAEGLGLLALENGKRLSGFSFTI